MPYTSLPWRLLFEGALRVASARRLVPASAKVRLCGIGIDPVQLDRLLDQVRSVRGWAEAWDRQAADALESGVRAADAGRAGEARRLWRLACGAALVAMGATDPRSAERRRSHGRIRRAHDLLADAGGSPAHPFGAPWEGGTATGFLRLPPGRGPHPLILLLPPLGHVKEEMGVAFERLLEDGYALAGLDLPGTGESPGPLPLDAQRVAAAALDVLQARPEIDPRRIAVLGISLGAYWTFKLAAEDPRPRLAIGISTPVMDRRRWRKLPAHLWRAFQAVFATSDPRRARSLAMQMTLEGVFQRVGCPALLYHGGRDRIPVPGVIPWLLARARVPVESVIFPRARHGCVDVLEGPLLAHLRARLADTLSDAAGVPRSAARG